MYKEILVVLLAVQYVHGSTRTLFVSELIRNYCGDDDNGMSVSTKNVSTPQNYSFDHALANLTDNGVINVTTNSILSFHNKITGLENVLISGFNNPTVYCYNTTMIIGGLKFDSCTNITIEGITWSGCGGITGNIDYPVIGFSNSSNITIRNCYFQYSKGQAVTLSEMAGDVSISHSTFLHNTYAGAHGGTAVHIGNQETPQVVFTIKYCNFTNNIGNTSVVYIGQSNDQSHGLISFHNLAFYSNKGVAIYLNHQNLYMYGDFVFCNNVADNGAGMFIGNSSNVYFNKTSIVEFRENTAINSGGAIFLTKSSTILLGQKSEFINNKANNNGGAVAINDNSLITNGNSITKISNSNEILNFSVCDDLYFMEGCHILFHNNTANGSGGAIFVNNFSTIVLGHNSTFITNAANNGGAVALYNNCDISNEQHSNIEFISNTALQSGGALYLSVNCRVSFTNSSNVMFKENNAIHFGGAIFNEMYSNISFTESSRVVFNKNNATFGESLHSRNTTCVTEIANVTYNDNTSQWNYGNKFLKGNDVTINADGVVRCTDYREYYICTETQCSCKHINDVTNHSVVTITDDITLSSVINLVGLNISLIGHNNATIYYKDNGLINFTSCRDLKIKNLNWNRYSEINPIPRLVFTNVHNVEVENCYFQYSKGKAIVLSQVSGNVSIDHCQFLYNDIQTNDHGAVIDYSPGYSEAATILTIVNCHFSHTETGDAYSLIYLEDSKNESDMVIIHDSEFLDSRGTCIYASNQNIYIRGTVSFKNNTADNGAGIFITDHSKVTFCSNSSVTFAGNAVLHNGGAIYSTDHSIITFREDSVVNLVNNEATQGDGGAVYSKTHSIIVIEGNASFSNNKAIQGGAIYSKNNSDVTFQNNSCAVFSVNAGMRNGRNAGNGGSIYSDSSCIKFDGDCLIRFNNNIVYNGNGGAVYSNNSDISFMGSSRVIFNKSEVFNGYGGAIFLAHESNANFQETSNIEFICNKATDGGALHLQNSSIDFTNNSRVLFSDNQAENLGGGICLRENNISFDDNSTVLFISNHAKQGGALYAEMNCTIMNEGTTTVEFSNNTGEDGGGIYFTSNSYLSITESSNVTFYNNEAGENGGGIYSGMNSDIQFSSDSPITLSKNTATQGGAIYLSSDSDLVFESCVMFTENEASKHGGSVYSINNCDITFKRNSSINYSKNKALNGAGGGIYCTDNSNTTFQEMSNTTFTENAARDGGALHYNFKSTVHFENNSMVIFTSNTATSGGAINFQVDSNGIFGGTAKMLFCNNTAETSGGAILGSRVSLLFEEALDKDPISDVIRAYCIDNDVIFNNATNIFNHNDAETGGAIFIETSDITFHSNSVFVSNKASQDGGAIYLSDQSNITFMYGSKVNFSKNDASDYGGAIYGKFSTETDQSKINFSNASILFSKNNARIAGNSVYINLPKACNSACLAKSILSANNSTIKHIATSPNQLKLYNPAKCIDGDDKECKVYYANNIMLGQEILLDACMYDYYNQPADAAQFLITGENDDFTLALNATFISCNHTVPDISINAKKGYNPKLPYNYSMNITLFVNRISGSKVVNTNLTVELSACHPGFWYDSNSKSCTCYNANDIVLCSDSSSTIRRGYWFGYVRNMPTVTFCPINYCNFSCCETSIGYYHLSPVRDNQCRSHRTGISCGNCEEGYVLSYDSTECINEGECTTVLIALVVILTVIYWIVLFVAVFIMMHFKVEIGYLYGLTYYYSIIDILLSQHLHFSNGLFTVVNIMSSIAKVTPQFLGQLCLFKTMSGIDQQFIHYAHPLAVSLILVTISILAKFSRRLTEFISTGIIHIICFLLLLSYTSVATTSLLLMRPLIFYDIDEVYTYLSPDLEYFHGRHLGYGILAILSTIGIVICLPFLLLSEPFINSKINFVKIKPLLDQFQGCYKDKCRSFAAYYMICRLVIIALFISNSSNDNFIIQYLLITTCVMAALIHLIVRPYTHVVLNVFDGVVLHIMILVAVLPFVEHYDSFGSDLILTLAYILVLLPFTIFIIMELLLHKEDIKEMIQRCKSFKLRKEKVNNNEIQLNEVNREIGIIVDENMRRNAIIVDV